MGTDRRPTVGPSPSTRLNTPFGTPASWSASVKTTAVIEVNSLGLTTTVHPVAKAAESFVQRS